MCAYIKEGLSEILTVSIKLIMHSSKCDIICTCLPKCLMSEKNCKKMLVKLHLLYTPSISIIVRFWNALMILEMTQIASMVPASPRIEVSNIRFHKIYLLPAPPINRHIFLLTIKHLTCGWVPKNFVHVLLNDQIKHEKIVFNCRTQFFF